MKSSLNQRRLAASAAGGGWFLAVARQGMQVKPVDSTSFKMVLIKPRGQGTLRIRSMRRTIWRVPVAVLPSPIFKAHISHGSLA